MLDDPSWRPVLEAFRNHVLLDPSVSEELTAFHEREGVALSTVATEARDLAGRLEPKKDGGHQSQQALESWIGAVLRGPHDGSWFDMRTLSPLRGWSNPPTLAAILVIASVRQRVTEIVTARLLMVDRATGRVADGITRLFDLEVALAHFHMDRTGDATGAVTQVDPLGAPAWEASRNIRNALGVIETSAYLIRRYTEQIASAHPRVEVHLNKIAKQVQRTHQEIARLFEAVRPRRSPLN